MKRFTSKSQKTGELGELLAERYLISKGFTIIERNATYQGGEIDIIATKSERIHFIEVKTSKIYVSRETIFNPFQNVSPKKIHKMSNSALLWLSHHAVSRETAWQMDAIGVFLNETTKKAKISHIPNINI